MLIALHKNATPTSATRRAIQQASGSDYGLAEQFGVSRSMLRKWHRREGVQDASHTPHRLQTTLNAEALGVEHQLTSAWLSCMGRRTSNVSEGAAASVR